MDPTIEEFLPATVYPSGKKSGKGIIARLISGGVGFAVTFPVVVVVEIDCPVLEDFFVGIFEGVVITIVPELSAEFTRP